MKAIAQAAYEVLFAITVAVIFATLIGVSMSAKLPLSDVRQIMTTITYAIPALVAATTLFAILASDGDDWFLAVLLGCFATLIAYLGVLAYTPNAVLHAL